MNQLLEQMTLHEKAFLFAGVDLWHSAAIIIAAGIIEQLAPVVAAVDFLDPV